MENKKLFSLKDVQSVATKESVDFALARLGVLSDGGNSHKINITKEMLVRDGKTILSKPVLAKYDKFRGDIRGHEVDEIMVGYIPENQEPQFIVNDDGETVMYVDAVISKIYATEVYRLFEKDNFRAASIEMAVDNERPSETNDGTDIDGFYAFGITILGKDIRPSDKNAHIKITRFSEKEADDYYTKEKALRLSEELRRFAESLDSKDKIDERTSLMEENVLQTEQFAENEDDNKDVVMSEGEQPKDEPKSEESKEMAEPKEEPKTEDKKDMSADEPKEGEDDNNDDEPKDKEMSCGGEKEMSCGGEKTFSLEQFASEESLKELSDEMAELVKMESADEVIKKFAEKLDEIKELSEKVVELEAFQTKTFEAEREEKVKTILAEVKADLEPKQFEELVEEGTKVQLSEINAFANKVKAFAYEASKNKTKENDMGEGVTLMASPETTTVVEDGDVWSRLSKKYN